jgi:GT2 family glycosyltransferase
MPKHKEYKMVPSISICIVNFNCLQDTKELLSDLSNQTLTDFNVVLYDQNSIEGGTQEYYDTLDTDTYTIIQNGFNKPLNHVWNEFAENCTTEYMMCLNNDIRIPPNYIQDTLNVYNMDSMAGIVVHVTNNPDFIVASPTEYLLEDDEIKQGWEFSLRTKHWVPIPHQLKFYCGDDFIFHNIHNRELHVGVVTSSPILHKLSRTRGNMCKADAVTIRRHAVNDVKTYKALGFEHITNNLPGLSRVQPITDEDGDA